MDRLINQARDGISLVWDGIVEVVGPGLDSEHILKLELMRFIDGLHVREINEPKVFDQNNKKDGAANDQKKEGRSGSRWGNNQKNQYRIVDLLK